jgi:hypothetical protein
VGIFYLCCAITSCGSFFPVYLLNKNAMINESSLSRIWQHITNNDKFAVISAFKAELTEEENMERHDRLRSDIRRLGLGYVEQKSVYSYSAGSKQTVEEKSFFIPKINLEQALGLGKKYEQETIIYKDDKFFVLIRPNDRKVTMTFAKGSKERPLTFDPEVLQYANSELLKANNVQKTQYAFKVDKDYDEPIELKDIKEMVIPSRSEAMKGYTTKRLAEAKWISIFN